MRRLLISCVCALVALIAFAAPARAHASLEESTPVAGAAVKQSPKAIELRFTERVEIVLGGIRVLDADGTRVDRGKITHPGGRGSAVSLALPELDDGPYIVTWRVVSADSHPIQGAFTFAVGDAAPASSDDVAGFLAAGGGSSSVGALYGAARAVAFAALLVLLGAVGFVVWLWPAGAANPRFRRVALVSAAALGISTLLGIGLHAAYASALGLGSAFSPSVIGEALTTQFGKAYLARLVLLVVAVELVRLLIRRAALPVWWRPVALFVGAGIAATPGVAGHASVGSHQPFAFMADVVHVGAAALWLGAMVILIGVLLPAAEFDEATAVTNRFSTVAVGMVIALVGTGLFQSYRQVGTLDALTSTDFGRILMVKAALVGATLLAALMSRTTLRRKWAPSSVASLRRSVAVEAVIAVGVVVATALLVNAVPAKTLAAAPQSGELVGKALLVDFTVSPGTTGRNDIHLYTLTKAGAQQEIEEMTLSLRLEEANLGPIDVTLFDAGMGHFQALDFDIPLKGRWKMLVTARTSDIDSEVFEGFFVIR